MKRKAIHFFIGTKRHIVVRVISIFGKIKNKFIGFLRVFDGYRALHEETQLKTSLNALEHYYKDIGKNSPRNGLIRNELNESKDLSIIIPIYNAEKYVDGCLKSLLDQVTHYSFEIILIDDGSVDDIEKAVKDYLQSPSVQFVRQKNAGQSSARNNGISRALGKYLMFVDADDVLLPGAIESLMRAAEETDGDIAEGSIVRFYDEITDEMVMDSKGKNHIESNEKNPRFVLSTYGYSVAKVFRRELWDTLRYPEGYIFEDVITKFILRRKANRVAFIEDVVYGYRQNNQSSSHGSNQLKKLDSIWVLPKVLELCEKEKVPRDDVFYLLALNHIGILNYITTSSHNTQIKLACFAEMRKQLMSIQDCRPKHMPLMFKLLDRSILENKFEAWEQIAETIQKYHMLKKWREIN